MHYGRCGFGIGRAGPLRVRGGVYAARGVWAAARKFTGHAKWHGGGQDPALRQTAKTPGPAYAGRGQFVENFKIRHRRRTCADDSDTDREILRQECARERSDERAACRKILSKGIPKSGCGAERRLRRMQRGGAGAAAAERKRRPKARRAMREPQPVKQERQAIAVRDCCPFLIFYSCGPALTRALPAALLSVLDEVLLEAGSQVLGLGVLTRRRRRRCRAGRGSWGPRRAARWALQS